MGNTFFVDTSGMGRGDSMGSFVNIADVPEKKGLKIAENLMDQHVLGPKDSHHAIKGAERISMIVQTYSPGGCHHPHSHPDTEQAFVVLSGKGQMHMGEKVFQIKEGSVAHAPRNTRHSTENTSDEDLVMVLIGVRLD
jgi:quercetin dioxygenase-like cupin family protein